jgi:outer membrane protein assembly factor BamB
MDEGYRPEEYATPIVVEGNLYVGHAGRAFEALDAKGEPLWQIETRGRVFTTAAYVDGLLIFGDDQGVVRAVDLSGHEVWRFPAQYPVVSSPLAAEGKVYVAVADQNVFCLDAATGRPVWQYGRKFPRRNALWRSLGLCYGNGRVFAGFADGEVVALDAGVGRVLWRAEVGAAELFGDVAAGPSYWEGRVYAGVFRGPVVSLDATTGEQLWHQPVEAAAGFAVGDDLLYLATAGGKIAALWRQSGELAWETALDGGAATPPVLAGGTVIAGASAGSLFALDARTGAVRSTYLPGPGLHGQPLVLSTGVVFLSDGGVVHWVR